MIHLYFCAILSLIFLVFLWYMFSTLTTITNYYIIVSLVHVNLLQHKLSFKLYDVVYLLCLPIYIYDNGCDTYLTNIQQPLTYSIA